MAKQRFFPTWMLYLLAATVAMLAAFAIYYLRILPPTVHRPEEFGITVYTSDKDADNDGVDDQTDILSSTREYVATKPSYKSAYYQGGRPTDGYGVCTDVVDRALLGAGYDLQAMVDADIRENPELYGIEKPDPNIDFRRVRNLRVFFPRHAEELSLDPTDLDAWQGGDIVCWSEHIGIVSEMRNAEGRALVIHHGSPLQVRYEEDVLTNELWGPIVGHWRMG